MDLICLIFQEMTTDMDSNERQSERIIEKYNEASKETKVVIDDIFISLCGWSLETLIIKTKGEL